MSSNGVYTHGHAESVLRSHRTRTAQNSAAYLLPQLRPGLDLLDIGSGPGTINVVHAHQVLQHVAGPVAALREMMRVCRPGGVVAARDADYRGFTWYPQLPRR